MSLRKEIQDSIYNKIGGKEHVGIRWTECQEATNEIISNIGKKIDLLYPENPIDTQYKTGYYNAICKVKEVLK